MLEQVTGPIAHHGEGPVWYDAWPGLRWVDMLAGDVLTLDSVSGEVSRSHVGAVAAVVRPRSSGGAVLALERGFAFADDSLGELEVLPEVFADAKLRFNEGSVAPDGSFYCGSMSYDELPGAGSLYRLDPTGRVERVLDGSTISNGLNWSPDETRAYYVDTPTQRIDVFDYAGGRLRNRRPFAEIDPAAGSPDGLCLDTEGGVWVALWGGGAVRRYAPDGELTDVIEVPAPRVTACAFGGPDLDELHITTSQIETDRDEYPRAGSVFRATTGARGLPIRAYDG